MRQDAMISKQSPMPVPRSVTEALMRCDEPELIHLRLSLRDQIKRVEVEIEQIEDALARKTSNQDSESA